ncbi:MAG: mucoidy inhibitor MuiA family protein [Myxococcota bacterium]
MRELDVALPVRRVTAYEDRAEVQREGLLDLPAGPVTVRVRGVSPLISDAHVVAQLHPPTGPDGAAVGTVDDVRVERTWTEDTGEQTRRLDALKADVEAAENDVRAAQRDLDRANERRSAVVHMFQRYVQAAARGMWSPQAQSAEWMSSLQKLQEELHAADANVDTVRSVVREKQQKLEQLNGLVRERAQVRQRMVADVVIHISGDGGKARLVVSALEPCALWRPAHEAHLHKDGTVEWTTYATVWQRTGESWDQVELTLSTARPSAGATLPTLREDLLTQRLKAPEERKQIFVEHREEVVPRTDLRGAAPGVYDGGVPRSFQPPTRVTIPDDGRPHRVAVGSFKTAARTSLVAMPELATHVFLRASLRNTAGHPLLAGPITLLVDGAHVGVGDLPYVGAGEELDVSFGSDDRFVVMHERRRVEEERLLQRERVHFVQEVELTLTGGGPETVEVLLRLPVSEVKQLKVVPSPAHCSEGTPAPDEQGLVKLPVQLKPRERRKLTLGFHLETSGEVHVPDPW